MVLVPHFARSEEYQCTLVERFFTRSADNCTPPTASSEEQARDSGVKADIEKIVKIGASIGTSGRSKLVRQALDPAVYSWSEVEYRFCLAYESCRISREIYEQLLLEGRSEYRAREQLDRINAVLNLRRTSYEAVRFTSKDGHSATVGARLGGGGKKQAAIAATCPAFAERIGPASLNGVGGCYQLKDIPNGASAVVSQTGEGRSACTVTVTCKLSDGTILSLLGEDEATLRSSDPRDLEKAVASLSRIEYPNQ